MKKTLLFISAITIGLSSYAQYEGFENWTQDSIQDLEQYETTASDNPIYGPNSAYPVTDPVTGLLAIKLETTLTPEGDTLFGFFISGDFDTQTPGQQVTLTGAVDSLIGYYKCNIQPNDSAVIFCATSLFSTVSGGFTNYFTTSQPTWTRFAFAINAALGADSILIAAASSDAINDFNGVAGTWIQFDDLQLKGSSGVQNIENFSFENWVPIYWEEPTDWTTSAVFGVGQPTLPVVKTTDVNSGSFALRLNTIDYDGDTLNGSATNGDFDENGFIGGVPFIASPMRVEFYYKNIISGIDTTWASVEFKKNGVSLGQFGDQLPAVANYTLYSRVLNLTQSPDTLLLGFSSGENPGSTLFIDDIALIFPVGIAEGLTIEKIVSYPNPATDVLKIRFSILNDNEVDIRLIDITGKQLLSRSLGNLSSGTYQESFNTSNLTTGNYFIEFTLGNDKVVEQFIVR